MHRCRKVQLVKWHNPGRGNTTMAIVETIMNSGYVDGTGSISLSQGSVSQQAHSGKRSIPR